MRGYTKTFRWLILFICVTTFPNIHFGQDDFVSKMEKGEFEQIGLDQILDSLVARSNKDLIQQKKLLSLSKNHVLKNGSDKQKSIFYTQLNDANPGNTVFADSSLHFALMTNDSSLISASYISKGAAYNFIGKNDNALSFYEDALKFSSEPDDQFTVLINSANVFLDMESNEEAKTYLIKSKDLLNKIPEKLHISYYSLLGYIYLNKPELDSSKINYTKALELSTKHNKIDDKLMFMENLGIIEDEKGNFELAGNIFLQVLSEAKDLGQEKVMLFAYTDLTSMYYRLKEYEKAIYYGGKEIALADKLESKRYKMNAAIKLSNSHKYLGNYKQALDYYQMFKINSDSLSNVNTVRKMTEMRVTNDFKNKHLLDSLNLANANIALGAEKSKRRNLTYVFVITLLAGIISLWQFFRARIARRRSDQLLLNILPKSVADELKKRVQPVQRSMKWSAYFLLTLSISQG